MPTDARDTRRIRLTLDLRTDLDPGRCADLVIDKIPRGIVVLSAGAKEIKPNGRPPLDDATKDLVLGLRLAGGTYQAVASASGLSRSSVIKICKADA
jgi:DNA invertase Pin-like site-specific DNA recombinase